MSIWDKERHQVRSGQDIRKSKPTPIDPWRHHESNHSSCEETKCRSCACCILLKLKPGTLVDVYLKNGTHFYNLVFEKFYKPCCATFIDTENELGSIIIMDCQDIQAIRYNKKIRRHSRCSYCS